MKLRDVRLINQTSLGLDHFILFEVAQILKRLYQVIYNISILLVISLLAN